MASKLRGGGRWRAPAIAFTGLTLFYVACAAANPMWTAVHGDGYYTYLWARSIVFDGDLDLHDDYRLCADPWGLANNEVGDDLNYWNVGAALFWAPILAYDRITHHRALDNPNPQIAAGCTHELSDRAVFGSFVAGLLACWLAYLFARRWFGEGPALFGALAIGALGPHLYYSTMLLSYAHAISSFGAALALWVWEVRRRREGPLSWLLMGLAFGLAILIRAQNAIFVIPFVATWLAQAWRRRRSAGALAAHVGSGVLFTITFLVIFFPQSWIWHHMTGSWITVPQGEGYMRWTGSMWHKALFAAQGLFPWSPIHYPALAGMILIAARRRTRTLGVILLLLFAAESYVVGAAYDWSGSIGFPGRRFDALVAPFAIGLSALGRELYLSLAVKRRAGLSLAAGILVVFLAFWNLSVSVGVGRAMRTDVARPSSEQWRETYGQTLDPLWHAIGNPLTYPASIPFAIHYGTHPRRWDVVGAPELFHHDERTMRWREIESTLDFVSPVARLYADGALEEQLRGLTLHVGSSRVFLPLHGDDLGWIAVRAAPIDPARAPRLSLRFDGIDLGTHRYAREEEYRYPVPCGLARQGIQELWLWDEDGPLVLERIQLLDPQPAPSIEAAHRNALLREHRRQLTGHRH